MCIWPQPIQDLWFYQGIYLHSLGLFNWAVSIRHRIGTSSSYIPLNCSFTSSKTKFINWSYPLRTPVTCRPPTNLTLISSFLYLFKSSIASLFGPSVLGLSLFWFLLLFCFWFCFLFSLFHCVSIHYEGVMANHFSWTYVFRHVVGWVLLYYIFQLCLIFFFSNALFLVAVYRTQSMVT